MRKRLQQLLLALATMIKEVNQERTRRNLPKEIPPKKRKANQLNPSLRASSAVTRIKGKTTSQSMLMESSKNQRKTRQKKVKGDSSQVEEETRSD